MQAGNDQSLNTDMRDQAQRNPLARTEVTLSVVVPLYNEEDFIQTVLDRVMAVKLPDGLEREIVVVDDASTDSSAAIVENVMIAFGKMNVKC